MNGSDTHHDSERNDRIKCAVLQIAILCDRSFFVEVNSDATHEIGADTKTEGDNKNILGERKCADHSVE